MGYGGVLLCPLEFESARGATFDFCAGALVGAIAADGSLPVPKSATGPFVDLLASVALTVPVAGPASLRLDAALGVQPVEEQVVYETANNATQSASTPSPVTAIGDLGVVFALP
jgi:hypothetical protein